MCSVCLTFPVFVFVCMFRFSYFPSWTVCICSGFLSFPVELFIFVFVCVQVFLLSQLKYLYLYLYVLRSSYFPCWTVCICISIYSGVLIFPVGVFVFVFVSAQVFICICMMTWQSIWSKLASWTYSGITLDIKVFSLWRTS